MAGRLSHEEKQRRLDLPIVKSLYFSENIEIKTLGDVIYQLFFNDSTRDTFVKNEDGILVRQFTGSARSIEDTYLLTKNYIPNITYKQVYDAIESLYISGKGNSTLSRWFCTTVKRRVHNCWRRITKEDLNKYLSNKNLNYGI